MSRYETIVSLGENFLRLMNQKLIPIHVLDWKVYYEAYLKEKELTLKKRVKSNNQRLLQLSQENMI